MTETQAAFLRDVYRVCRPEVERIPEIESCGSTSAEELNAFADRRGLAVSFGPFGQNEAAAVSVLDLFITWTAPGKPTRLVTHDRRRFPAVRHPASQVKFRRAASHPAPIAEIGTVSGDTVYLTPLASAGSDLVALARRLTDDSAAGGRFSGVVFPMVDLEVKHELDVVVGLTTRRWTAGLCESGRPTTVEPQDERARCPRRGLGDFVAQHRHCGAAAATGLRDR